MAKNKRHDWAALHQEFIENSSMTIPEFLRTKGMSLVYSRNKRLAGWVRDRVAYQKEVVEKAREKSLREDVEDIAKIRLRHARLGRFMQLKGAEALKDENMKVQTIDDARKLLISGLDQERKALGLDDAEKPGSLTQNNLTINVGPKTQLDRMLEGASYEDILGLIAELKRVRAGHSTPEIIEASETKAEGEI